jgi:integral membrane sensor domain MASE1
VKALGWSSHIPGGPPQIRADPWRVRLLPSSLAQATQVSVLALVYFAAGKLGLHFATLQDNTSPIWAPTGIALAALLLWGLRLWPGVLIGAFLVNMTTAGSALSSLGIATGNALEAVIGAYLVTAAASGIRAFESPKDVLLFALLAAGAATTISANVGVTSLCATNNAEWHDFGILWTTFWSARNCAHCPLAVHRCCSLHARRPGTLRP